MLDIIDLEEEGITLSEESRNYVSNELSYDEEDLFCRAVIVGLNEERFHQEDVADWDIERVKGLLEEQKVGFVWK